MKKKVLRERREQEDVMETVHEEVMNEVIEPKKRGRKKKDD